jgi:hypothetical protein
MFASKDLFFTKPSGGYQISRSVRLRSSASAYFNRTFGTPTNNLKWAWSGWVKRGKLGVTASLLDATPDAYAANWANFYFTTADKLQFEQYSTGYNVRVITDAVFRDPSAWYHIFFIYDSANATANDRVQIWVNGVRQSVTYLTGPFAINTASKINVNGTVHREGVYTTDYADCYLADTYFIDGQTVTSSSFGETNAVTGVWQPKKYAGTYGANGSYLNFSDNSNNTAATIGKDYSGNGNNWTPNNISVTAGVTYDSMIDVPTNYADGGNGRGNYCVLNPIDSAGATISDGNLKYTLAAGTNYTTRSTIGMTSGKWYAEWTWTGGTNSDVGIATSQASLSQYLGQNAYGWIYYNDGNKYTNGTGSAYGATYAINDVIGIAFDADSGTLTFYKNGTSQGTAFTGLTSGPYFFAIGSAATTGFYNFGQRPFTYNPPTGFVALNTQNLPTPTISNGAGYMAATLYTGNGGTQSITNTVNGISFQPDLVWNKSRSTATAHNLTDSVRGVQKSLFSNSTAAELASCELTAFNSNGYTLVRDAARAEQNENTVTYVGWQWKAGGTAVTNTAGSITSTVSAGATQGFSVVTFTAQSSGTGTVGHGLGVAPKMLILKTRSVANNWPVYHASIGFSAYINLNLTSATTASANAFISTSSTTFGLGTDFASGNTYVAYCFAEVAGYSKFGSYTGNASTDGPFVYCGFRPRWIMYKSSSAVGSWDIRDTSRSTYNTDDLELYANLSNAEASSAVYIDVLSNGFKIRNSNASYNGSGVTYIFAAFAENPFKNSLAR